MFVKVAKCPTTELARTNFFILNPDDFARIGSPPCVVVSRQGRPFIINLRPDSLIAPSYIGTSLFHRRWASLSLNEEIQLEPLREAPLAAFEIVLEAEFAKKNDVAPAAFDGESMAAIFKELVKGQILTIESQLLFEFQGYQLLLTVKNIEGVEERAFQQAEPPRGSMRPVESAKVVPHTDTVFYKARNSIIKIRGDPAKAALNPIIQPNFKFEDLGIGGLKNEFSDIFRRAFASRIFPPSIVERMGIQHIKGILLFGPPGTGKTLMARQIGKMLNAREPVIINGPEVLNKYVGASEENIRKLFAPAEQEYKEKGDDSQLHIIIFDELDAICRQRGSKSDSTGVGDSIVNQLLAKLDGVDQLNNILLIGMTNRKDMIDEALLRPGRLEVHMEIGLPDEGGRIEIINIHTSKMRANNLLGQDVDPVELASRTKNFSGAEIFGLVKSASSFAFTRHVQVGQVGVSADAKDIKVLRDDFMHALEEVRAAFGASEAELHQCIANGIIKVRATESILEDGGLLIKQVASSDRTPLVSALLYGPAGSGKTALAAMIAISSKYPFIKLISPENMIGMSESQKINEMHKVFNNASKSDLSVIMIDDIERILDWVPIGPRFSNNVLQALLVLLKKQPPSGKRLLVICTATQKHVLDSLDLTSAFDSLIYTPPIQSLDEIGYVLDKLSLFETDSLRRRTMEYLGAAQGSSGRFQITMKRLIMCAEMARQDEEKKAEKLVELLSEVALVQNDRVRLDDL